MGVCMSRRLRFSSRNMRPSTFMMPRERSADKTLSSKHFNHSSAVKKRSIPVMALKDQLTEASRQRKEAANLMVQAQYDDLSIRGLVPSDPLDIGSLALVSNGSLDPAKHLGENEDAYTKAYMAARARFSHQARDLEFDSPCRTVATEKEKLVDGILHALRKRDQQNIYRAAEPRIGHANQVHPRFDQDHFLSNIDLIDKTALYHVAHELPKGAHLHIHLNACLKPQFLLDIAAAEERMFITSDLPLLPDNNHENLDKCAIQFSLKSEQDELENPGNLFSSDYVRGQTMKFSEFLNQMPHHFEKLKPMDWLVKKLVFHEEEAHGALQTAAGAWELFNNRTRMMKGLFNYERAFRTYMKELLKNFVKEKILYAEVRPTFMESNFLFPMAGGERLKNEDIMGIIIEEVEKFKLGLECEGSFYKLKVIYCTPRSSSAAQMDKALDECIAFKQKWPGWIAGFDVVGEEGQTATCGQPLHPLKNFIPQFLKFRAKCETEKLDIPFLFHCGETLDRGTDTDGNLVDALLLGAKRIGHGFALAKHPHIMQQMKAKGVCVELCPISNSVLGLTPRVSGHAMYTLLANNVPCTVNSDNGTLFQSSLSHDFYQVMVGSEDVDLYGWKQLVLWSIENACLDDEEQSDILNIWEKQWDSFLDWVVAWAQEKHMIDATTKVESEQD